MGVREVPPTFRTSDGKEFTSKPDAERHEALVAAAGAYESAQRRYAHALWESQQTADGQRFKFEHWDYYHIAWSGDWPCLGEVHFYPSRCTLDETDALLIHTTREDARGQTMHLSYRIDELYADERAAKKALLAEQRKRLAGLSATTHALAVELGLEEGDEEETTDA